MRKLFFSIVVAFTLTACNSVLRFQMDVLRPGCIVSPLDKNSILLIDNSGIQPSQIGHAFYENFIYVNDTVFETEPLSGFLLESVSGYLPQEGFYKNVGLCKRTENRYRSNSSFAGASMFTPQQVKLVVDSGKVDLLVSLDRMLIKSKTNVYPSDYNFRSTRDVQVSTVWRVFDVKADSLLTEFQYKDSLYWECFSYRPDSALKKLPDFQKMLPEIGDYIGDRVAWILGPHWEKVERLYFSTGSFRMKYAVDCVRRNDWEGAAALWREEFDKGFGRSVYRAAMNMMLYSEYLKDPNEALAWSKKVQKVISDFPFGATLYDQWLFLDWVESLRVRSKEFDALKIYFKGVKNEGIAN